MHRENDAITYTSFNNYGIAQRLKPVFHFKRTVPKRIKNVFKFQNFITARKRRNYLFHMVEHDVLTRAATKSL
jgi:hypothetical protein